jgi:hypothetical protein
MCIWLVLLLGIYYDARTYERQKLYVCMYVYFEDYFKYDK